jgi:hypothetical protein
VLWAGEGTHVDALCERALLVEVRNAAVHTERLEVAHHSLNYLHSKSFRRSTAQHSTAQHSTAQISGADRENLFCELACRREAILFLARRAIMRSLVGSTNESVLPVPVRARANRS